MASPPALAYNTFYHIFSRGIGGADLFIEERNYHHFMRLHSLYVDPVAITFAWCLLKNHFHLLVRIKTREEIEDFQSGPMGMRKRSLRPSYGRSQGFVLPSRQFSHFFNAYAKAINTATGRSGRLLQHPFRRVLVTDNVQFFRVVAYIHRNPEKHGFVADFRDWKYSSYHTILSDKPTKEMREMVDNWFGGRELFELHHRTDDVITDEDAFSLDVD